MRDLRRLRRLAGMTQCRLARLTEIDRSTLSLAETSQTRLTKEQEEIVRTALLRAIQAQVAAGSRVLHKVEREEVSA